MPNKFINIIDALFYDDSKNKIIRLSLAVSAGLFFLVIGLFWTIWIEESNNIVAALRFLLAPIAAMGFTLLIAAKYVQDIYELPSYLLGLKYIIAAISGFGYPVLRIANGQADVESESFNLLDQLGGPGWLIIEPGNIVLLERLDSPSDILGFGLYFVNRFHRIKNIISLKDQHATPRTLTAITKDGIYVKTDEFEFGYRLETGHHSHLDLNQRTMENPYPFSVKAAKNMTYNRSINKEGKPVPWDNAVQLSIDGAVTEYINQHYLDEILFPSKTQEDPRKAMSSDLIKRSRTNLKMYGAEITWHKIGRFDPPDAIKKQMVKVWNAKWAGNATILRAQGEAVEIASQERGRAEGEINMLAGIMQALDYANLPDDIDENMWNIVMSRTAQVIETMTKVYTDDEFNIQQENE